MSKNVKILVYCAACIALASVASMIKLFEAPMGGSITLCSMLFATLPGYFFGPSIGIISGIAYGILQFILGPYIVHPLQVVVDYGLAFGALGLSGFFCHMKNGLYIGYLVSCFGRWVFAVLSGVVFFSSYAQEAGWTSPLLYSCAYNGFYIAIEAGITLVILAIPAVRKAIDQIRRSAR